MKIQKNFFLRRCVWAAIVVSSLIFSLVLMHTAWTYNAAHSTLTVIETTHHGIWNYPFPAVTICNNNQISREKARNFVQKLKKLGKVPRDSVLRDLRLLVELLDPGVSGRNVQANLSILQNVLDANNYTVVQVAREANCSELLKSCKWKGNVTPCRELFEETTSRDGHCCSFNYFGPNSQPKIGGLGEPRRLTACGYQTGLEVLVDARPRDYWASLQASFGVKVMLHEPHDYPVRSSAFKLVGLGVQELLDVSPESTYSTGQVRSLPVRVRDCIFSDEPVGSAALRQLELEHSWNSYSYVNCLNSCRAKIVLDNCGCVPHYLPKNALYDSSWPGKIVDPEQMDLDIEERPCGCMLDCSNYRYPVDSSEGILDQSRVLVSTRNNVDKLSLINVFFTDLVSIQYRRYVYYDWKALFASFGGLLGLFVGFSLITGFELVYFFVIRVLADECKKSRAKKRRSTETIDKMEKTRRRNSSSLATIGGF
uniref:Sodium channel protein Nach n=1 Tax=Trichogramma kaykai TaxID=54128 RepID=A0ABD2WFA5_9HYME